MTAGRGDQATLRRPWRAPRARTVAAVIVVVIAAAIPYVTSSFVFVQIVIQSLWMAMVAASLVFLVRFAGMVSLAQTGLYGTAGYVTANLSAIRGLNPWAAAGIGVLVAVALAFVVGMISSRARGVYFIMLTLAVGVFLYYFALQYRPFTFGFSGINGVRVPDLGPVPLSDPLNFYWFTLALSVAALVGLYTFSRSPLGLALQADRDCPERVEALGMSTTAVRVIGFTAAGAVASVGGVLSVWFNGQISPGSLDITRTVNILVVAVLGGVIRLEGAWLGALLFTALTAYVSNITNYYNSVIGLVYIAVVLVSPNGVPGLFTATARSLQRALLSSAPPRTTARPVNGEK
ncbi:branched-chain amino acid ABC transporter permease [Sphaerisporangium perillae]|uniref:branched-chain amino acid ABC transporter permease n=1 Tax=Sphaerisporangium perillae TaxID=2935860 RepID=UPI0024360ACB|nr:branched-chain amino acid ABC transporter permease [Sphaerisporangium perillae]